MLGAVGLGDLGRHFPDTDPVWEGANSVDLLTRGGAHGGRAGVRRRQRRLHRGGGTPRLAPHTEAMAATLSAVFGGPVSVKATRAEGLGALGRAEGIACLAVVLLEQA